MYYPASGLVKLGNLITTFDVFSVISERCSDLSTIYKIEAYPQNTYELDTIKEENIMNEFSVCVKNNKFISVKNPIDKKMPEIISHKYIESSGTTIIEWSDGTKTSVTAENPETADKYVGFEMAIAKKAMGNNNKFNNLADYWLVKKPKKEAEERAKAEAAEAEKKRIEASHRAKIEKYLISREALRLKREYEAKKLANKKFGVPIDSTDVK